MGWSLSIVEGAVLWLGTTLLIDSFGRRRKRRRLLERLEPYQLRNVADQAESWLREQ